MQGGFPEAETSLLSGWSILFPCQRKTDGFLWMSFFLLPPHGLEVLEKEEERSLHWASFVPPEGEKASRADGDVSKDRQ